MDNNKEDLIKEQRISEAMINGYIGQNGKFAYILRWLGSPIIEQIIENEKYDFLNYDYLGDDENFENLPELSEDSNAHEIGYYFDGLKFGYNLSIKYDNLSKEIIVVFNGRTVYKEESGELLSYVPIQEWESIVKILCEIAKNVESRRKNIINNELKRQIKEKKQEIYKDLNQKWGI